MSTDLHRVRIRLRTNWRQYSLVVSLLPLVIFVGCVPLSTVQIRFSADVEIIASGKDGLGWAVSPREFVALPPLPDTNPSAGFPIMDFGGKEFGGIYWVSDGWIAGRIRNHTDTPVCIRFDQAALQSNSVPEKTPLRVRLPVDPSAQYQHLDSLNAREYSREYKKMIDAGFTAPIPFCIAGQTDKAFRLAFDQAGVFRSGAMFDARWENNEPVIHNKGTGNWLKLFVPIEYGELRQQVEVTLTAKDIKARKVNYYF